MKDALDSIRTGWLGTPSSPGPALAIRQARMEPEEAVLDLEQVRGLSGGEMRALTGYFNGVLADLDRVQTLPAEAWRRLEALATRAAAAAGAALDPSGGAASRPPSGEPLPAPTGDPLPAPTGDPFRAPGRAPETAPPAAKNAPPPAAPPSIPQARPRPGDSPEAAGLRNDYRQTSEGLDRDLAEARQLLASPGQGTHKLPDGRTVTVRSERSRVSVTVTGTTSFGMIGMMETTRRIEYIEGRNDVRVSGLDPDGKVLWSQERHGHELARIWAGGMRDSLQTDGDALVLRRISPDGSLGENRAEADGSARLTDTAPGGASPRVTHVPRNEARARAYEFLRKHAYSVGEDGSRKPLGEEALLKLAEGLKAFPPAVQARLEQSGLEFFLVDPLKVPKGGYPGNLPRWLNDAGGKNPAGGYFSAEPKPPVIVLTHAMADHPSVLIHEVGHALDYEDARRPSFTVAGTQITFGDLQSHVDRDAKAKALFEEYKQRSRDKAKVWSDYALNNVREYLAVGVEFYLSGPSERQQLKALDPKMYAYVEAFLKEKGARPS